MRLPIPLLILNTLYTLRGAFGVLRGILFVWLAVTAPSALKTGEVKLSVVIAMTIAATIVAAVMLAASVGLWRRRPRSSKWLVGASIADGLIPVLSALAAADAGVAVVTIAFAAGWNVPVAWYLLRPATQERIRGNVAGTLDGRPRGFAVVVGLLLFSGASGLFSFVFVVKPDIFHNMMVHAHKAGQVSAEQLALSEAQVRSPWFVPSMAFGGLLSALFLGAAVGLLRGKRWGRTMMLGLAIASAVTTSVNFVLFPALRDPQSVFFLGLGWVWELFVLWYLYQPHVGHFLNGTLEQSRSQVS